MTDAKPLAVGDRVRVRDLSPSDDPHDPPVGAELTVVPLDPEDESWAARNGLVALDWPNPYPHAAGRRYWLAYRAGLERIDPAPPADEWDTSKGLKTDRNWDALLEAVRTLTAERDAARAGLESANEILRCLTPTADAVLLARAEKAEAELAEERERRSAAESALGEHLAHNERVSRLLSTPRDSEDGPLPIAPEWLEQRVTDAVAKSRSKLTTRTIPRPEPIPERYPLWCHDSGGAIDEGRFSGPFVSEDEALGHDPLDLDEGEERPTDECLRRCRALRISEADVGRADIAVAAAQAIADVFNDESVWKTAAIGTIWWPDSDALVAPKLSSEAVDELLAWADKHILTDVYVCEGDE